MGDTEKQQVIGADSWTRGDGFRVQVAHLTFDM